MLNLIKAEVYKYSKRPFTYIATLFLCIGTFLVTALVAGKFSGTPMYTRERFLSISNSYFSLILILMMIFCPVIAEDYKEGTFKNLCTSNVSKIKIFLSRFIVQIILAIIISSICMAVFLLSINMIKPGDSYSNDVLKGFVFRFITAIPIYLGGIAIVNFLVVILKKEAIVCILYFIIMQLGGAFFILEQVFNKVFGIIWRLLLSTQFGIIGNAGSTTPEIIKAMTIGLIYMLVFTTIAAFIFNKQELK